MKLTFVFIASIYLIGCGGENKPANVDYSNKKFVLSSESRDFDNDGEFDSLDVYTYDIDGKLLKLENYPNPSSDYIGLTEIYKYDESGILSEKTMDWDLLDEAVNRRMLYAYDDNGYLSELITHHIDPYDSYLIYNTTLSYTNDDYGNVLTKIYSSYSRDYDGEQQFSTNHEINTYTYDVNGNKKTLINKYGDVTSYTYASNGSLLKETNDYKSHLGEDREIDSITIYSYDSDGKLLKKTEDRDANDVLDAITTYAYDKYRNLKTVSFDRWADGNVDSITTFTWSEIN